MAKIMRNINKFCLYNSVSTERLAERKLDAGGANADLLGGPGLFVEWMRRHQIEVDINKKAVGFNVPRKHV
jgi:hypothetical protein